MKILQRITTYVLYVEQTELDGSKTQMKSEGTISPRVKTSYDIEKMEDALMKQSGKKCRITLWFPIKSIYKLFPRYRGNLKKKEK